MGAYLVHPYEKEQKLKSTVRHVKKIPNERLVKHRETGVNIKTKDARMNKNEKNGTLSRNYSLLSAH
jgi:hypothetical protein